MTIAITVILREVPKSEEVRVHLQGLREGHQGPGGHLQEDL